MLPAPLNMRSLATDIDSALRKRLATTDTWVVADITSPPVERKQLTSYVRQELTLWSTLWPQRVSVQPRPWYSTAWPRIVNGRFRRVSSVAKEVRQVSLQLRWKLYNRMLCREHPLGVTLLVARQYAQATAPYLQLFYRVSRQLNWSSFTNCSHVECVST